MKKKMWTAIALCLIGAGFVFGVYITHFKAFPYHQVKGLAVSVKNYLLGSNIDSRVLADAYRTSYPHLRVTQHGISESTDAKILVRSNSNFIPKKINFFDPLSLKLVFSLNTNAFFIKNKPLTQCTLMNGETCNYYAEFKLKQDHKLQGDYFDLQGGYLVSFEENLNERALEPQTDFIKFKSRNNCKIAVVYPDYTYLAYNMYGGFSLYSEPFPLPGFMESSVVAYDRPVFATDITKTYLPTNVIAREIKKMGLGCVNLESNSTIDQSENLENYKLVILTGHDEYWTESLATKIDKFTKRGGSLAIFSGNTNWRRLVIDANAVRRDVHTSKSYPTELITGLACRFGCLPLKSIDQIGEQRNKSFLTEFDLKGMKVLNDSHPIFKGTNLKNNDFFGRESSLVWYEVDGAPIDLHNENIRFDYTPKVTPIHDGITLLNEKYKAQNVIPLASSYLIYFGSKQPQYSATVVELKNGKGLVINGGSVGWFRALSNEDKVSKRIFQNIIEYLLLRY